MLRIIHSSDYHWEAEKIDKCILSSRFIIDKLKELKPDLHVISGDYWNRRQALSNGSAFLHGVETLRELGNICPVVIIKGNNEHDQEGSVQWFYQLETTFPIYATERAETICLTADGRLTANTEPELETAKALIHLFPYPTKAHFLAEAGNLSIDESNKLIEEAIRQLFLGMGLVSNMVECPVILAGHCNVSGAVLSTGQVLLGQDIMINKHDLELARADCYMLGHIHDDQDITPVIWFAGSTYHCNWGEIKKKSFRMVVFDETIAKIIGQSQLKSISKIEIPSRPLSLHECEIGDIGLVDKNPKEHWNDWFGAELRIRLYQTKEQLGQITDEQLQSFYSGAFSYTIERITIPDERIRSSEITACLTLVDKVKEWAKTIDKPLPEEVLVLAAEIEGSVER